MKRLPRIANADVVIHGVLRLTFGDGYEGVLDLRPVLGRGKVFTWLQDPAHFQALRIDEYGHSIGWLDDTGYDIAFSADSLRRDCERQAAIHELMVG